MFFKGLNTRNVQRSSHPSAPTKIRPSDVERSLIVPQVNIVGNKGEISDLYRPDINLAYADQIYIRCGKIGEGSFGNVYRIKDRRDNEYYALKMIKPTVSVHNKYIEIGNNEKIGEHENIVKYFMSWEEVPRLYMLFEHCDISVSDYADTIGRLPTYVLWYMICDMSKALEFIHGKNFVHLDIKPSNILIKGTTFKLGDFGILFSCGVTDENKNQTKPQISDGDSKYLPHEVLENVYLPPADIYSLGISILELACNIELPNRGMLWHHLRRDIFPEDFIQNCERPLVVIVQHMMRFDYKMRPTANKLQKYTDVRNCIAREKKEPRERFMDEIQYDPAAELDLLAVFNGNGKLNRTPSPTEMEVKEETPRSRRDPDGEASCSHEQSTSGIRLTCARKLLDQMEVDSDDSDNATPPPPRTDTAPQAVSNRTQVLFDRNRRNANFPFEEDIILLELSEALPSTSTTVCAAERPPAPTTDSGEELTRPENESNK